MLERKYLLHYLDANFGVGTPNYVRLGEDLEEYNEELNPQVETKTNIMGQTKSYVNGWQPQSTVEPYYCYEGDPLFPKLAEIANERKTGNSVMTTKVDVLVDAEGNQQWAYREDVKVTPTSIGGDTSGVQIPFTMHNSGNRTAGTWNATTKTFNPTSA